MQKIIPVILCGGSGTRLWPLSRTETPKQFLKLMDDRTLLQQTAVRTMSIAGISGSEIVVVTLDKMREETIRQLEEISPQLSKHVLGEPEARNTAAAVAYALHYIKNNFGDNVLVWLLPADHYVGNEAALSEALYKAVTIAQEEYLVTFGIKPTRPETGYGYILQSAAIGDTGAHAVDSFVEKPAAHMAEEFMKAGNYLWSSGMHLFRITTGLDNFNRHAPDILPAIEAAVMDSWNNQRLSSGLYKKIASEPFETAVLQKASRIAVVPCDPSWSDIGCWESLWEIRDKDPNGNTKDGAVFCHDTEDSLILAHNRLVTCVGLKNVIIVETGDSVLVADKKCNSSLKALVETLRSSGRKEATTSPTQSHHWGAAHALAKSPRHSLQEVTVKPGRIRDTTTHSDMSGHAIVTSGEAIVVLNGQQVRLKEKESIFLPSQAVYGILNPGKTDLKLYEFLYAERERPRMQAPPMGRSMPELVQIQGAAAAA